MKTIEQVKPIRNENLDATPAHTPGPWQAIWNGFNFTIGNAKTGNVKGNHDYTVATTAGNSLQDEANAALIASAPELLAVLETCLAPLQDEYNRAQHHGHATNAARAFLAARTAIAKAKGEIYTPVF